MDARAGGRRTPFSAGIPRGLLRRSCEPDKIVRPAIAHDKNVEALQLLSHGRADTTLGFEPVVQVVPVSATPRREQLVRHLGNDVGWRRMCLVPRIFSVGADASGARSGRRSR